MKGWKSRLANTSMKKKLIKFLKQAERAPPGCDFEVGLIYDAKGGWRIYERIHETALLMSPKQSRAIADVYDEMTKRPEWVGIATGLEWVPVELRKLAAEAEQKDRDGEVPEHYAEMIPTEGTA